MEKIKILVADDDREIVNAICTLLEEEGYETVKAYNGKEVMQCMHEQEVQLILLDIMMPYQDGLTTTLQIRNEKIYRSSYFLRRQKKMTLCWD